MSNNIFADFAEKYWEAGYSVISIEPISKIPSKGIDKWSGYNNNLPTQTIRKEWLNKYHNHGIGLLTGMEVKPDYRIAAVDVDDDNYVELTRFLLGNPVCTKRGKKGATFIVLAEATLKSTKFTNSDKMGIIDFLSNGRMTVLPPTIHKDTQAPYVWGDKSLLDCTLDELPICTGRTYSLLKRIIESEHTPQIIAGHNTHDSGLRLCGSLVQFGCTDEEITGIFQSLLPVNYSGDSLEELKGWIPSAREQGFANINSSASDERVARLIEDKLKPIVYVLGEGVLCYQNGHWSKMHDGTLDKFIKEYLLQQPEKGPVAPKISNAKKCLIINTDLQNFGKYSSLICCKNGTLDIETGELLDWSPTHQLLYQLDVEYDPQAACPIYEEFVLRTLCEDIKAVATFEEFAGLTFVPDVSFQKALYLLGPAGSGKSTLLRLVESMHSKDAITTTPLDKIDGERYLTDLARKLVCISSDIQSSNKAFGEAFIRITGGDPIAVRKLYLEVEGRVKPTVRFMGSMNRQKMPSFLASPDALERRLIFLTCGDRVQNPDRKFYEKLQNERKGILNRWTQALRRLRKRGDFDVPDNSNIEVSDYVRMQDTINIFAEECLFRDMGAETSMEELVQAYNNWSTNRSMQPLSATTLGRRLKGIGIEQTFSNPVIDGVRTTKRVYRVKVLQKAFSIADAMY